MDQPSFELRRVLWNRAGIASVPAYFESSIAWAGNKPKLSWNQAAEYVGEAFKLLHHVTTCDQPPELGSRLRDRLHRYVRDADRVTQHMLNVNTQTNDGAPNPWAQEAHQFIKASQNVIEVDENYTHPQGMCPRSQMTRPPTP